MAQLSDSPATAALSDNDVQAIDRLRDVYRRLRDELGRVIIGQHDTIERLSICLFARGPCAADGRAGAGEDAAW